MKALAKKIKSMFGNNPFEIAHQKNILVVAEPLGNIHGYYSDLLGQRIIHVNDGLHPTVMEYVATYLLGNEFIDGFKGKFYIQKSFDLWTPIERKAHKLATTMLENNRNTVLEHLTHDELLEITAMLDKVWFKDTLYCNYDSKGKLEYVLSKFL